MAVINHQWLEPLRKQELIMWQYPDEKNRIDTLDEILSFVQNRLSIIKMISQKLAASMAEDMKKIIRSENVDAQTIVTAAEKVMYFYRELIDLKTSFKFVDAVDPYKIIVEEKTSGGYVHVDLNLRLNINIDGLMEYFRTAIQD